MTSRGLESSRSWSQYAWAQCLKNSWGCYLATIANR